MEDTSLHSILSGYTKPQLQDIGEILGTPGNTRVSKARLVDALDNYLHGEPRRWLSRFTERDLRQLRELVHAGPDKVVMQSFSVYPTLGEMIGLVSYDEDEQSRRVWINREVYDLVKADVDAVLRAGEHSGRFELERMGLGLMNLYGAVPMDRFLSFMVDWYLESHPGSRYDQFVRNFGQSTLIKLYRYQDETGDYMVSPCVHDPYQLLQLREHLGQRDHRRNFTYEEVHEAGSGAPYFTVGMKTAEGMRLEAMYRRVGYTGFDVTLAVHDTWVESQYTDQVNDELYGPLVDCPLGGQLDPESLEACCEIIADYANSVPKWFLCGKSAKECGVGMVDWKAWRDTVQNKDQEEIPNRWKMPEPTISEGFASEMQTEQYPLGFAIPHVAPDDPCPCGSGLRYCHCHGKYLS